ncbi:hypothetical protein [Bradyrhizobium cenepequi]
MQSGVSRPTLTRTIQRLEQELGGTSVYRIAHVLPHNLRRGAGVPHLDAI